MLIKFETEGIEPIPNPINSDVPMKEGDKVYHLNPEHHRHYRVINTTYIVDDCDTQFWQVSSLRIEE